MSNLSLLIVHFGMEKDLLFGVGVGRGLFEVLPLLAVGEPRFIDKLMFDERLGSECLEWKISEEAFADGVFWEFNLPDGLLGDVERRSDRVRKKGGMPDGRGSARRVDEAERGVKDVESVASDHRKILLLSWIRCGAGEEEGDGMVVVVVMMGL